MDTESAAAADHPVPIAQRVPPADHEEKPLELKLDDQVNVSSSEESKEDGEITEGYERSKPKGYPEEEQQHKEPHSAADQIELPTAAAEEEEEEKKSTAVEAASIAAAPSSLIESVSEETRGEEEDVEQLVGETTENKLLEEEKLIVEKQPEPEPEPEEAIKTTVAAPELLSEKQPAEEELLEPAGSLKEPDLDEEIKGADVPKPPATATATATATAVEELEPEPEPEPDVVKETIIKEGEEEEEKPIELLPEEANGGAKDVNESSTLEAATEVVPKDHVTDLAQSSSVQVQVPTEKLEEKLETNPLVPEEQVVQDNETLQAQATEEVEQPDAAAPSDQIKERTLESAADLPHDDDHIETDREAVHDHAPHESSSSIQSSQSPEEEHQATQGIPPVNEELKGEVVQRDTEISQEEKMETSSPEEEDFKEEVPPASSPEIAEKAEETPAEETHELEGGVKEKEAALELVVKSTEEESRETENTVRLLHAAEEEEEEEELEPTKASAQETAEAFQEQENLVAEPTEEGSKTVTEPPPLPVGEKGEDEQSQRTIETTDLEEESSSAEVVEKTKEELLEAADSEQEKEANQKETSLLSTAEETKEEEEQLQPPAQLEEVEEGRNVDAPESGGEVTGKEEILEEPHQEQQRGVEETETFSQLKPTNKVAEAEYPEPPTPTPTPTPTQEVEEEPPKVEDQIQAAAATEEKTAKILEGNRDPEEVKEAETTREVIQEEKLEPPVEEEEPKVEDDTIKADVHERAESTEKVKEIAEAGEVKEAETWQVEADAKEEEVIGEEALEPPIDVSESAEATDKTEGTLEEVEPPSLLQEEQKVEENKPEEVKYPTISQAESAEGGVTEQEKLEVEEEPKEAEGATNDTPESAAEASKQVKETIEATTVKEPEQEAVKEREFSQTISAQEEDQEQAPQREVAPKDQSEAANIPEADSKEVVAEVIEKESGTLTQDAEEKDIAIQEPRVSEISNDVASFDKGTHADQKAESFPETEEKTTLDDENTKEVVEGDEVKEIVKDAVAEVGEDVGEEKHENAEKMNPEDNDLTKQEAGKVESDNNPISTGEVTDKKLDGDIVSRDVDFPLENKPEDSKEPVSTGEVTDKKLDGVIVSRDVDFPLENKPEDSKEPVSTGEVTDKKLDGDIVSRDVDFSLENKPEDSKEPVSGENEKQATTEGPKDPETTEEFQDEHHEEAHSKQKHSNNILSKVKQSLVKAKKAIIGKHSKTTSSET
ncbi:hypothetical protein Dimus_021622 [Dionaea muscipula]